MKRIVSALTVLALLFACTPEENNPGGNDNNGKDNGGNKEVVATAIKLNKNDLILEKGGNETLTVTFTPSNVTNKNLTWVSSNKSIAEVTDGIVVGVEVGTTEIVVKNGDLTDKCTVTVVIAAKSITLNKESLSFKALNQTETLTATVDPASTTDTVEWTSSDPNVATVADGVVTSVAPGAAEITVSCGKASAKCSVTVEVAATAISLSENSLSLIVGNSKTLTATVEPANTTDKLEWSSSAEWIATVKDGIVVAVSPGETEIVVKCGDATDKCKVTVTSPAPVIPEGAVDLGIEMTRADGTIYKLYWATSNLSEDGLCPNPEDYGDYYAWGETEPYYSSQDPLTWKDGKSAGYDWASYKWCNGDYNKLTRYCPENKAGFWDGAYTPDNKTEFADYNYADDAARARLGGKWRMPTDAEWEALLDNCTWTWTTQNGVSGRLVTSKTNSNSIFLPAAGDLFYTILELTGSAGHYWSSSLCTDHPDIAWCVFFVSSGFYRYNLLNRYGGFSVRPVSE